MGELCEYLVRDYLYWRLLVLETTEGGDRQFVTRLDRSGDHTWCRGYLYYC